jgi:hypothetical protein
MLDKGPKRIYSATLYALGLMFIVFIATGNFLMKLCVDQPRSSKERK